MLEEEVARYIEMHHILLCGDFNSRTGQVVMDIDANVPSELYSERYSH